jgi:glycosyltransferase involved in cell wall biosynthesis
MRIVNIIQRYPPSIGGSETWCQEVCRYLAKKGNAVKVLTLDINKEEEYWREPLDSERSIALGRLAFDDGVIIRRYRRSLPVHSFYHLFLRIFLDKFLKIYFYGPHSVEMYGKMWREIKSADVVFLHTVPYPHNYIAFFIAKLFRKKTVIIPHFHPAHPHYERKSIYWLLRKCDCVITVTEFEKHYLKDRGISEEKLFVTGNGIHAEHYLPVELDSFRAKMEKQYGLDKNDKVITFIGRKRPEKGVGHLIKAVQELLSEMPLKLFLVGPTFDWYNELYTNLSEEEKRHIIELGMLSEQEKINLLHLSHLLALPSQYEAFGIVFLEAWACGVPVLGTTESAMPSVIGKEGFLCTYGDSEDLKLKLQEALSDMERLKTMGSMGKAKVLEHYTWDKIGESAERAIQSAHKRKKIILCSNAYPPYFIGGAELIVHQHAKILKKLNHDVIIFSGQLNNSGKRYSIKHDTFEGIPVFRVCLHSRDFSSDFFSFTHKEVENLFDNVLEDFSPDIVHFHNIIGLSAGLIQVAKQRKIKTVLTLHDYWGICHKNTLINYDGSICEKPFDCEKCQQFISGQRWENIPTHMRRGFISSQLHMVDTFISPSNYLANMYVKAGLNGTNMNVIPNGIDVERFSMVSRGSDGDSVRYSFIGYLGKHKGLDTIIEALPLLKKRDQVLVNIVGYGEHKPQLEALLKRNRCDDIVRFWGPIDNNRIEDVYRETDVLILPSIWPENNPVSITEAMASGIPVIASRIGGIPEIVDDGKTGYLFEAGNAHDLAKKMSEFFSDRTKLTAFGENASKKIAEFTLDNQVKKITRIYSENQPGKKDSQTEDNLIVCLGKNLNIGCTQTMDIFIKENGRKYKFFMLDWLPEDVIKKAQLLWVVDNNVDTKQAMVGLRNHLPLLVPENNLKLKNLCREEKCGLYYNNALEASVCLEFLVKNKEIQKSMGNNAFQAFYENS